MAYKPKMENLPKWEKAIQMLAAGGFNCDEIYTACGISKSQYYRWRQQPEFQEAVKKEARTRFVDYVGNAISNIVEIANNDSVSDAVRLKANQDLLDRYGITIKQEIDLNAVQEIVIDIFGGDTDVESANQPENI